RPALGVQLGVEVRDTLGNVIAASALEAVEIHHDHVVQVLNASVSEHHCALADELAGGHFTHAQLFAFARHHQRTHLQEPELCILTGTGWQLDGELDFHGSSHGVFADGHELLEDLRQRK